MSERWFIFGYVYFKTIKIDEDENFDDIKPNGEEKKVFYQTAL